MQTIKAPVGAPDVTSVDWRTPTRSFTAFEFTCSYSTCGAVLLVDDPDDVHYRAFVTWYVGDVDFQLYVACPHCGYVRVLERYAEPGNPARQDCVSPVRPAVAYLAVPTAVRSRAYQQWEDAQDTDFWRGFFGTQDMRYWAASNPRAARKLRSRLLD